MNINELIFDELKEMNIYTMFSGSNLAHFLQYKNLNKDFDIDLFFTKKPDLKKALDYFYKNADLINKSENSTTFFYKNFTFDLINLIYSDLDSLINSEDFTICKIAIDNNNELLIDGNFYSDFEKKILQIKNYSTPRGTLFRIFKYTQIKGYSISFSEIKKFIEQNKDNLSFLKFASYYYVCKMKSIKKYKKLCKLLDLQELLSNDFIEKNANLY